MLTANLVGALLLIGGVVYMGCIAINRSKMSDLRSSPDDPAERTLEPRHRGLGFLGVGVNWPGLLMVILGCLLLLASVLQGTPPSLGR
jgi:hypothetical protein